MIDFGALGTARLRDMLEAGMQVVECHRALARTGDNIVGELLPRDDTFYQFDHCPPGDIYDTQTHSQFYYHAHREGEHGHFHTFMRQRGMPEGVAPVEQSVAGDMKDREDTLSHIVAISMSQRGLPIGLFTTNRWVTAENWYAAPDVCAMIDRFRIDHAQPSWPVNLWISAMIRLFRPQIEALLHERDAVMADWKKQHPGEDVFEDRELDLPSHMEISVDDQIRAVQAAL
ncbi:MAG: hypothetical protein ACE5DS_03740 [Kiloniellaceae bacterium]